MLKASQQHRAGRMFAAMMQSENETARMELVVEISKDGKTTSLHDTFQIRKWKGRMLFVSIPDTADWEADPVVKPVTPLSVNIGTGEIRTSSDDPRVTKLVEYAGHAVLRFALTGETPNPENGTVKIVEQSICGACGKKLKDPESIRDGVGPDCYEKLTGTRRRKQSKKLSPRAAKKMGQGTLDG